MFIELSALFFLFPNEFIYILYTNTIKLNYYTILNYFKNRSTNASAESFNVKIKAFRAQFRSVKILGGIA